MSMFVRPEQIVKTSLRLRAEVGYDGIAPVCPFEVANALGVRVRLLSLPSLEGMYSPGPPTIIVGSQRPFGRRNFTCAHELGHHVYRHGYRIDEVLDDEKQANRPAVEYVADRFAAALLMPKLSVLRGFSIRGAPLHTPDSHVVAIVADELGVGYQTLVRYMTSTLKLFDGHQERSLLKRTPKRRRLALLGKPTSSRLVVVDSHWRSQWVTLDVGDLMLPPSGSSIEGIPVAPLERTNVVEARAPGTGMLCLPDRGTPIGIRVSRKWFSGIAHYRFLEDYDDDE